MSWPLKLVFGEQTLLSLTVRGSSSLEGLKGGLGGGTREYRRFLTKHHDHYLNQTIEV